MKIAAPASRPIIHADLPGTTRLAAATSPAVDVALVLAVDVSSSIDAGDYQMQMDGIADALSDPAIRDAIAAGPNRRIALALVQWSTAVSQATSLNWRPLASRQELVTAARDIKAIKRQWRPGGTGLAAGVDYSIALFQALPVAADRRVIDVSGDGADNDNGDASLSRNNAVALGITINGLPLIYGSQYLLNYYHDQVIGGPGAFLEPAADLRSFREAMLRKLLREIGAPVS